MAKIKFTKTELKAQQDLLKQFRRFLPTLQLKKQQLQLEIARSTELLEKNLVEQRSLRERLSRILAVFSEKETAELIRKSIRLSGVRKSSLNIAGVIVPIFEGADFEITPYDVFGTDWIVDAAFDAVKEALSLRAEYRIVEEQHRLLTRELQITTQRVNLFEKVKIPESRDNIRRIRIYLTDMDTAAVVRSKIAKKKSDEAAELELISGALSSA